MIKQIKLYMINQQIKKDSHSLISEPPSIIVSQPNDFKKNYDHNQNCSSQREEPMDEEPIELIKQLLALMKMEQTLQTLQNEREGDCIVSNPEHSGMKIPSSRNKQQIDADYIQRLIRQSTNLQTILGIVQQSCLDAPPPETNKLQLQKLTNALQNVFRQKQSATIPIFKALDLQFEEKHILFVDINQFQQICLLDSQNYLHVIDSKGMRKSCKIGGKRLIVLGMKWMDHNKLVIGTNLNEFLLYSRALTLLKTFQPEETQIVFMEMHLLLVLDVYSRVIIIITQNTNGYVAVTRFFEDIFEYNNQVRLENNNNFFCKQQIKSTAVLVIVYQESTDIHTDNQLPFFTIYKMEHYYAVMKNNSIVKFDSQVNEGGTIWQTDAGTVVMMVASRCLSYLHLIIAINTDQPIYQKSKDQHVRYEFVKINAHGATITRIPLNLNDVLKGERMEYIANLEPDWLCCTTYNNNLIYFSLCTGNIVYVQQLEYLKRRRYHLKCSGPKNCLLLRTHKSMRLLSTIEQQKKDVVLNYKVVEPRDQIIRRFSLIQGLPQNLRFLLESIRNNEL